MVDQPTEVSPVSTPSENPHSKQVKVLQLRIKLLSIFLTIAVVLVAGLFVNQQQRLAEKATEVLSPRLEDAPNNTSDETLDDPLAPFVTYTQDPEQRIVFAKKGANYEQTNTLDFWTTTPDGSKKEQLKFDQKVFSAIKYPNSSNVFYFVEGKNDTIFVKDLLTGQTKSFVPIKHPQPDAQTQLWINSVKELSPDESGIVMNVSFYEACPTLTPEEMKNPPMEGGPCMPDAIPDFPTGDYYIDLKTQKKRYLGEQVTITGWDTQNKLMYYHTGPAYPITQFRSFNYNTGEFDTLESSPIFGYWPEKLFKSDQMILNTGETGNSGEESYTQVAIVNMKTHEEKVIDKGQWADIQPFMAIPPDESVLLYQRKDKQNPYPISGIPRYNLMRYDFSSGQVTQLSPDTVTESYNSQGYWVDNDHFITAVNTLEEPYFNNNNQLINVNVKTGQILKLTDVGEVAWFMPY